MFVDNSFLLGKQFRSHLTLSLSHLGKIPFLCTSQDDLGKENTQAKGGSLSVGQQIPLKNSFIFFKKKIYVQILLFDTFPFGSG